MGDRALRGERIDEVGGRQNPGTPNPVLVIFNRLTLNQVQFAAEDRGEFVLHSGQCQERHTRFWSEHYQHVDVAFGVEVVSQDRAEEFELRDMFRSQNSAICASVTCVFGWIVSMPEA